MSRNKSYFNVDQSKVKYLLGILKKKIIMKDINASANAKMRAKAKKIHF